MFQNDIYLNHRAWNVFDLLKNENFNSAISNWIYDLYCYFVKPI